MIQRNLNMLFSHLKYTIYHMLFQGSEFQLHDNNLICFNGRIGTNMRFRLHGTLSTSLHITLAFTSIPRSFKTETRIFSQLYLANQEVCVIKMPAVHFWSFPGWRFNLDANFHSFTSFGEWFVVCFNSCHDADVYKLK